MTEKNEEEISLEEILLRIDKNMEMAVKLLNNFTFNQKLILRKLNLDDLEKKEVKNALKILPKEEAPKMKATAVSNTDGKHYKIAEPVIKKIEKDEFKDYKESSNLLDNVADQLNNKTKSVISSPVTIRQQLVYDSGGKASFASITITDSLGNFIEKKRTSSSGVWSCSLIPGIYNIRIEKNTTDSKKNINMSFPVEVKSDISPQDLGILIVHKEGL